MPAEDEAAAGVAVEAMSKCRRVRQTEAQLIKGTFKIRTAAGSAMHGNPCRLVENQDQTVSIKHPLRQKRQRGFRSQGRDSVFQGFSGWFG